MSQEETVVHSDPELSPMQEDESSSEDASCMNLRNATVVHHAKMKNNEIKKAYLKRDVTEIFNENETILNDHLTQFYTQLQSKEGVPLTWYICIGDKSCILKIITKNGKSVTSSSLVRHPCYKKWNRLNGKQGGDKDKLTSDELEQAKKMIQEASLDCTVKDIRPLRFTEGAGVQSLMADSIAIGVKLGKVPNTSDMKKIIPSRYINKKNVMGANQMAKEKLRSHLSQLDKQPLPPFHAQFDLWEDKAKRRHYMAVMAVEANYDTQELDVYCLDFFEWESQYNGDIISLRCAICFHLLSLFYVYILLSVFAIFIF